MTLHELNSLLQDHPGLVKLKTRLQTLEENQIIPVHGVSGSLDAIVAAFIQNDSERQVLYVVRDQEKATRVADDLRLLIDPTRVGLFQSGGERSKKEESRHIEDIESLQSLSSEGTFV